MPSMRFSRKLLAIRPLRYTAMRILSAGALLLLFSQCRKPHLQPSNPEFDPTSITAATPVLEVLTGLGFGIPDHRIDEPGDAWADAGRQLIFEGKAFHPETGAAGEKLSVYFYCADCHNSAREEERLLSSSDPETKLLFLHKQNLPLVPGSPFAGIVNRETFFNGDYAEDSRVFGDVSAARGNLRKAVALCAKDGALGRVPDLWEIEAIVAYFQTIQWTMGDLALTGADLAELKRRALNPKEHPALIEEIRALYPIEAPATFGEVPEGEPKRAADARSPDPENGRLVFERSCLHCHDADGASEHFFGDRPATWRDLANRFSKPSGDSLYRRIRLGSEPGRNQPAYMPLFTRERLSDAQIEDLRAYLERRASEPKPDLPPGRESPENVGE